MDAPCWIELDAVAVRANVRYLRTLTGNAQLLAAVKANAYGHGLLPMSQLLRAEGVDMLGIKSLAELRMLRESGDVDEVLMLNALLPEEMEESLRLRSELMVSSLDDIVPLQAAARRAGTEARVHLKVDTGMGRLGALPERVGELLHALDAAPELHIVGICTHLPVADEAEHAQTERHLALFDRVSKPYAGKLIRHAANSAALMRYPASRYDMVRAGTAVYGLYPSPEVREEVGPVLAPVLALYSRIGLVKDIPAGAAVSYGSTWVAARPSRIAILPVGYSDGYVRAYGNSAHVLVRGTSVPVIGRVCMNMTVVDVTALPDAAVGDTVTLIGQDGAEEVGADQLAVLSGTINYEVVTRLDRGIAREIVRN